MDVYRYVSVVLILQDLQNPGRIFL